MPFPAKESSMKQLPMITVAALLCLAGSTQAEILFRGVVVVTAVNAACAGVLNLGDQGNAQFHPRELGNDNFSALTTINEFGGHSYSVDKGSFAATYKKVITGGLGWSKYDANAQASVLLSPVPALTLATETLTLTGKIKNPNGNTNEANCEASFRGVMYKHVE
jgi:hypothetical protein